MAKSIYSDFLIVIMSNVQHSMAMILKTQLCVWRANHTKNSFISHIRRKRCCFVSLCFYFGLIIVFYFLFFVSHRNAQLLVRVWGRIETVKMIMAQLKSVPILEGAHTFRG